MTRKIIIPLILLAATTAHADSLLDQGMNLVEQGQAFLRGNDGVILRKAWGRGDVSAYTVISDRAIHGNDIAQNLMGVIFDIGKFGQNKNSAKALEWFNKSALNNNFVAFYNLGIIYSNGRIPGLRQDPNKAAKAFEKVYQTKRGKAIPQVIIWLAIHNYNIHNYPLAWKLCSELTTQKWAGYTDYLKARMLLEGTSPDGKNPQAAIQLLEDSMNRGYPAAAALLEWAYQSQNDLYSVLVTQMIVAKSTDIRTPIGMSQNDVERAQSQARLWLGNHASGIPEVLDFTSTITGFEAWVP